MSEAAGNGHLKRIVRQYMDVDSKYFDGPVENPFETEIGRCYADKLETLIGADRKKVLDVGAGTGYISILLAGLGHQVTGVDLSRAMLAIASRKAAKMRLDIPLVEGDADDLPFASQAFDAVVSRYVLWTLPDPELAIREWSRLVRPGGRVVVIDGGPQAGGLRRLVHRPYYLCRAALEGRSIGEILRSEYPADVRRRVPGTDGLTGNKIAGYMTRAGVANVRVMDDAYLNDLANRARPRLSRSFRKIFIDPRTYIVYGDICR